MGLRGTSTISYMDYGIGRTWTLRSLRYCARVMTQYQVIGRRVAQKRD